MRTTLSSTEAFPSCIEYLCVHRVSTAFFTWTVVSLNGSSETNTQRISKNKRARVPVSTEGTIDIYTKLQYYIYNIYTLEDLKSHNFWVIWSPYLTSLWMLNPTHWKHFQNQHKYLKHVLHLKCTAVRIWMKEHVNYIFLVWIRPKSSARHENTSISHLSTAFWTLWFQRQSTRAIVDTALESSSIVANSSASKLHSPFMNRRRSITTRNAYLLKCLRLSCVLLTCNAVSFLRKFVLVLTVLLRRWWNNARTNCSLSVHFARCRQWPLSNANFLQKRAQIGFTLWAPNGFIIKSTFHRTSFC